MVLQNGEVRRAARMPLRLMDSDFIIAIRQKLRGSTGPSMTFLSFEVLRDAAKIGMVEDPQSRKAIG